MPTHDEVGVAGEGAAHGIGQLRRSVCDCRAHPRGRILRKDCEHLRGDGRVAGAERPYLFVAMKQQACGLPGGPRYDLTVALGGL